MTFIPYKTDKQLPDSDKELIMLGLNCLEQCVRDSRYCINVAEWHYYDKNTGLCNVCIVGAVMAKYLDLPHNEYLSPSLMGDVDTMEKLRRLNYAAIKLHRTGIRHPKNSLGSLLRYSKQVKQAIEEWN